MPIGVRTTRLLLQSLFDSAGQAPTTTLGVALKAAAYPYIPLVLTGKQLVEAQSDGVMAKYEFPTGAMGVQVADVTELFGRLLDLYNLSTQPATNIPPGGGQTAETGSTPSQAVFNWMMSQLVAVKSFYTDHTQPGIR